MIFLYFKKKQQNEKIIITETQLNHIKETEKKNNKKDVFLLLANIAKAYSTPEDITKIFIENKE